jgi:hypothetical protein
MDDVALSPPAPISAYTCVDCDFSALYTTPFAPWRRTLGLVLFILGVVVSLGALPWFIWRSRVCSALAVRQPAPLAVLCGALIINCLTPYRGECWDRQ